MSQKEKSMKYSQLKQEDKDYINYLIKNKPSHITILLKHRQYIIDYILEETSQIIFKNKAKFTEKLYCYINNITKKDDERIICSVCKEKRLRFINFNSGYNKTCSAKCSGKHPDALAKVKKTSQERYGVDNPSQHKDFKEKFKKTSIEKYGTEHPMQSEEVQKNIKKTNIKKYGVENVLKLPEIQEKIAKTNEERYGFANPMQNRDVQEKGKRTNKKRYGAEYIFSLPEFQEKAKETLLERYGFKHPLQVKEFYDKRSNTMIQRYGVPHSMQSPELRKKTEKTNIQKYGFSSALSNEIVKAKIAKTNLEEHGAENVFASEKIKNQIKEFYMNKYEVEYPSQKLIKNYNNWKDIDFIQNKFVKKGVFYIEEFMNYFNINNSTGYKHLKKLNIKYDRVKNSLYKTQSAIFDFIRENLERKAKDKSQFSFNITPNRQNIISIVKEDKKKKLELDIYIELFKSGKLYKKVAIEYNGLMFHSFGKSKYSMFNNSDKEFEEKHSHLLKTRLCEEKNIQLLHINENEWESLNKRDIWKSTILSKLGIIENKIYARECVIKEINSKTATLFLEENHIQGKTSSKIKLGLFKDEVLVSLMTFSKTTNRYNKNYEWELIRFCSLKNHIIVGGGSKLLSYFEKEYKPKSLISYGNRKWSYIHNNFYLNNGFNPIKISEPGYQYFKEKSLKVHHRTVFQKKRIKKYFENSSYDIKNFNEKLTETLNMYNNGYRKIYDSGQLVFVKTY